MIASSIRELQTGFPAGRYADDDAMGRQVIIGVQKWPLGKGAALYVDFPAKIQQT